MLPTAVFFPVRAHLAIEIQVYKTLTRNIIGSDTSGLYLKNAICNSSDFQSGCKLFFIFLMDFSQLFLSFVNLLTLLLSMVIGITVHEAAHAWVANKLGDPTAKLEGRISLNPLVHLDPLGTLSLLIMHMVGWGRSVPYNPANFKHPIRDAILTALAGPAANLLVAMLLIIPIKHILPPEHIITFIVAGIVQINLALMVFNLLPIPPLDGSKLFLIIFAQDKFKDLEKYAYIPSIVLITMIGVEAIFRIPLLSRYLEQLISSIYLILFQIS